MARTKQTARQTGGKAPRSFHTKPPPKGRGKGRKGARALTRGEAPRSPEKEEISTRNSGSPRNSKISEEYRTSNSKSFPSNNSSEKL